MNVKAIGFVYRLNPQHQRPYRSIRLLVAVVLLVLVVSGAIAPASAARVPTFLTLQSSPNPATVNDSVNLSGILTAGKLTVAAQNVQVQYSVDKKQWTTSANGKTGADGRYTASWKASLQGVLYLRGYFAGNAQYASVFSSVVTQSVKPSNNPASGGSTLLMTNGTDIGYANGTVEILRGVNLNGYEYVSPVQRTHSKSDYATIASWGFNVVRLPISWENLEPQAGSYNDNYLRNVDQDIAWAKQYGIFIILDMHQICWSSHFASCNGLYSAGIPKWAVSGYADSTAGIQLMINDFFSGLGPNGTPPSPSNPSMQQRFFVAWQHVASRYKGETTIAAYDILNEPSQYYKRVDATFTSTTIPTFYTKAIDAIRAIDPYHICIWENPTSLAIQRPNVVYSPHYPGGYLSQYSGASMLDADMQQIIGSSRSWNVPIFIGEWGIQADASGAAQYVSDSLSQYDTYSIGAAWWAYGPSSNPMAIVDSSGSPRPTLLQNLVRPFVRQLSSAAILTASFNALTQSLQVAGTTSLQIFIAIPAVYSVVNIQTNTGAAVNSQFSLAQRALLIAVPQAVSQVTVQYTASF